MITLTYMQCTREELTLKTLYCLCEAMISITKNRKHIKLLDELKSEISIEGKKFLEEKIEREKELNFIINKL